MSTTIGVTNARPQAVSVSDLFNQIAAGVSLRSGQTINTLGQETLTITRKHTGVGIILVCVLLFPIGLLALLARSTQTISVSARMDDGQVVASANGVGDEHVVGLLNHLLEVQPPAAE